jgi:hypothetical protein
MGTMTRRRAAAQSAAPLDLLRRAVRGLLREADLSGRPLALVGRLVEINRDLAAAGLALEIGLATYPDVDDEQRFEFAARSRLRRGEPRGYTRRDLREPDSQLSVVYQLQEGDVEALAAPGVEELLDRVPWGAIVIEPAGAAAAGPCAAAWVVQLTSNTRDGWGPLLYDAAMEWASSMGGGLAPDRRTVSPEAAAVWGKYVSSRGDVVPVQLDVRQKDLQADPERWGRQLTPDDAFDDCVQKSAQLHSPEDWSESPLSRAFRKTGNPVTAALRAADLFWTD